jgi:nitrite reductase/ring-hydroxylating ferredoxin subunit
MPLLKVGSLSELPPGTVKEVELGGENYAICNLEGSLHCLEGICPHAGGPLGQGTVRGNNLVCPLHEYEFDLRTGLNDMDEDLQVKTFPVHVQNGDVFVEVP